MAKDPVCAHSNLKNIAKKAYFFWFSPVVEIKWDTAYIAQGNLSTHDMEIG